MPQEHRMRLVTAWHAHGPAPQRKERAMGPFERRAVTYNGDTYAPGGRFRVIGDEARLDGQVPELGGSSSWRQQLRPGDLLTCTGDGFSCAPQKSHKSASPGRSHRFPTDGTAFPGTPRHAC
jgi:hypothetical protein